MRMYDSAQAPICNYPIVVRRHESMTLNDVMPQQGDYKVRVDASYFAITKEPSKEKPDSHVATILQWCFNIGIVGGIVLGFLLFAPFFIPAALADWYCRNPPFDSV